MAYAVVQFSSDQLDVGHTLFTLTQTGLDTGSLDRRFWADGVDPTGEPTNDDTYALTHIRVLGNVIKAKGPNFSDITFTLSRPGITPHVEVLVTAPFWYHTDNVYPLSAADYAAIEGFKTKANYPAGP